MPGRAIPHPVGDPDLGPDEERAYRRRVLERALEAISTPVKRPTVFSMDDEEGDEDE